MRIHAHGLTLLLALICSSATSLLAQQNDRNVQYVIQRYTDAMGGIANLEKIKSVRLIGTVKTSSGVSTAITVLKKKPNLVRISIDSGTVRFIQGYDGETAWYGRQTGMTVFYDRMRGSQRESFIREAPLENLLIGSASKNVKVELGEDVSLARQPCYQIIATLPDGSKIIHYIEKETFLERRILEYDKEGELISEMIPGQFENVGGVVFAKKIIRLDDGKPISTIELDEIELNIGILNTAFVCPVELPEQ